MLEGTTNFLYTAPTSAGKTLVAEVLMLRRLIERGKGAKALFVVPLRALVEEKARDLEKLLEGTGLAVQRYTSGSGQLPMPRPELIAVCTNEKAAMVVQSMASEGRLDDIVAVVYDEFHGVGADSSRGATLEVSIAKLLTHARRKSSSQHYRRESICSLVGPTQGAIDAGGTQIIGMTATLPNMEHVARWLTPCEVFQGAGRPVALEQRVVYNGKFYLPNGQAAERLVEPDPTGKGGDEGLLAQLVLSVSKQEKATLVFCATRDGCERAAKSASLWHWRYAPPAEKVEGALIGLRHAAQGGSSSLRDLEQCLRAGVAFHHAEMTDEEKKAVEAAMATGAVRVIFATTSLAEGVNLPVRRVILRELFIGVKTNKVDPIRYKQMAGRAGRTGMEARGEVVLIARSKADVDAAVALMGAPTPPARSRLADRQTMNGEGLRMLMLEAVAAGLVQTEDDAETLLQSTLLWEDAAKTAADYALAQSAAASSAAAAAPSAGCSSSASCAAPPLAAAAAVAAIVPAAAAPAVPAAAAPAASPPAVNLGTICAEVLASLIQHSPPLLASKPLPRNRRHSISDATLFITPHGRASSSANVILRCGSSGVDALALNIADAVRDGVYLLSDVHLIYICFTDAIVHELNATSKGILFPKNAHGEPLWINCFARQVWPPSDQAAAGAGTAGSRSAASRRPTTHLARVVQLVDPAIDELFISSLFGPGYQNLGSRQGFKLQRLWLAQLLSLLMKASDPAEALLTHCQVRYDPVVFEKLLGAVSARASALVRYCEEIENGSGRDLPAAGGLGDAPGGSLLDGSDSWAHLLVLLRRINEQLRWGTRVELLPLLEPKLPTMNVRYAGALYAQGYRSLDLVAASSTCKILNALQRGMKGKTASKKLLKKEAEKLRSEARQLQAMQAEEKAAAEAALKEDIEKAAAKAAEEDGLLDDSDEEGDEEEEDDGGGDDQEDGGGSGKGPGEGNEGGSGSPGDGGAGGGGSTGGAPKPPGDSAGGGGGKGGGPGDDGTRKRTGRGAVEEPPERRALRPRQAHGNVILAGDGVGGSVRGGAGTSASHGGGGASGVSGGKGDGGDGDGGKTPSDSMMMQLVYVAVEAAEDAVAFSTFRDQWLSAETFALTLHFVERDGSRLSEAEAKRKLKPPYNSVSVLGAAIGIGRVVYYLPVATAAPSGSLVSDPTAWHLMRTALAREEPTAIILNLKMIAAVLLRHNVRLGSAHLQDPTILGWLLSPHEGSPLETLSASHLAKEYLSQAQLGRAKIDKPDALRTRKRKSVGGGGTPAVVAAAQRASYALTLLPHLERLCEESGLSRSAACEVAVSLVLARLEIGGFKIDCAMVLQQRERAEAAKAALEARALALGIRPFCWKPQSPDTGRVIFDELNLGAHDPTKRIPRKKNLRRGFPWETNSDALRLLADEHPLPMMIVKHRSLSAFVDATWGLEEAWVPLEGAELQREAQAAHARRNAAITNGGLPADGYDEGGGIDGAVSAGIDGAVQAAVHTTQQQLEASTGRITTTEPNLQGLQKEVVLAGASSGTGAAEERSEQERIEPPEAGTEIADVIHPRVCMRPSAGCVILSVDFKQIELRMLAHFSQDASLLAAFSSGTDPFYAMAADVYGSAPITKESRDHMKAAAYKLIYGSGATGIARELGIDVEHAQQWVEGFYRAYPGVKRFMKQVTASCRSLCYVTTLGGRRRQIQAIRSESDEDKSRGERQAFNTVLQGSAADLLKAAMVRVDAALGAEGRAPSAGGRLLLTVHDEFVLEVEEARAAELRDVVRQAMVGAWPGLRVPLEVSIKQGPSWGELEEV